MTRLRDLRLDEETWTNATALRRSEWRAAIEDILDAGVFAAALAESHLLVTYRGHDVLFEALNDDGFVDGSCTVTFALVEDLMREYRQIIERLDEGAAFRDDAWLHAVDMAKKVVHDKAAQKLADEVPELSGDHPTLRKIFTLLFSLAVDTTKMTHARHHRFE